MNVVEWSQSGVEYGRRLVDSALEGALAGEDEFLKEEPLAPYLGDAARQSIAPVLAGACIGVVTALVGKRPRSASRAALSGLLGGVIGFGVGVLWDSRKLTASVASGAWRGISKTRDEHWLEKHPIDYA